MFITVFSMITSCIVLLLLLHFSVSASPKNRKATDHVVTYLQFPVQVFFSADSAFILPRNVHA